MDAQLSKWRDDTPGVGQRVHLNNAGAGLMPSSVLSAIMKTETGIAATVFLSIRNSRAQREALDAAAQVGLTGRELEMFSAIAIVYQSLDSWRTDLAHGIFAVSEDLPNALLWMDSKHYRSIMSKTGRMCVATTS